MNVISSDELALHTEWRRTGGKSGARLKKVRADLSGADLGRTDLSRADLRGAEFRYADLRGADMRGTDLGRARLRLAFLRDADLTGAVLEGADLTGAALGEVTGLIDGGQRSDGYRFVLVQHAETPMISADCRWLTPDEARAHWGAPDYRDRDLGDESLVRVDMMLRIAARQGWPGAGR